MDTDLNNLELRVIGCLIEKGATTPDSYPLTLNALINACNQKTSRDPVMDLGETTVQATAESLQQRGLVSTRGGAGNSRVTKYSHRLGKQDLLFEKGFGEDELAVLSVLFLRGPQTLAEIKTRTQRQHAFADIDAVTATIEKLKNNSDGPYVQMLERQAGHKEPRCTHLFGSEAPAADDTPVNKESHASASPGDAPAKSVTASASAPTSNSDADRLTALEKQVAELSDTVAALKQALGES